jgi:hypothetical protein
MTHDLRTVLLDRYRFPVIAIGCAVRSRAGRVQYAPPPLLRWPIAVIRLLPQGLFNKIDI